MNGWLKEQVNKFEKHMEKIEDEQEIIQWAQQNPEAWEALRTGRGGVYATKEVWQPGVDNYDNGTWEIDIIERLDKPFKSEAKEEM